MVVVVVWRVEGGVGGEREVFLSCGFKVDVVVLVVVELVEDDPLPSSYSSLFMLVFMISSISSCFTKVPILGLSCIIFLGAIVLGAIVTGDSHPSQKTKLPFEV